MNPDIIPSPRLARGQDRRALERAVQGQCSGISRATAQRAVNNAMGRLTVQPDLDVLAFAVADVRRRARLADLPLLMRGGPRNEHGVPDPTPANAFVRMKAGAQ